MINPNVEIRPPHWWTCILVTQAPAPPPTKFPLKIASIAAAIFTVLLLIPFHKYRQWKASSRSSPNE